MRAEFDVITPYREESEGDRKGLAAAELSHRASAEAEAAARRRRLLDAARALLSSERRLLRAHAGAYVRDYVGEEIWRSYFKFAFDRNPWDRQISWYLYKTKTKASRPSFESFMASRRRAYVSNHEIYMEDGALAVDFVGRYEDLDADLAKALRLIGVARRLDVPKSNVGPNKETRQDYRSYYTPQTEALVREWYAPEIELLKYGF